MWFLANQAIDLSQELLEASLCLSLCLLASLAAGYYRSTFAFLLSLSCTPDINLLCFHTVSQTSLTHMYSYMLPLNIPPPAPPCFIFPSLLHSISGLDRVGYFPSLFSSNFHWQQKLTCPMTCNMTCQGCSHLPIFNCCFYDAFFLTQRERGSDQWCFYFQGAGQGIEATV